VVDRSGMTYDAVGATDPAARTWAPGPHRFETNVRLGAGEQRWAQCRRDVLQWAVKTRSGFRVTGDPDRVEVGQDYELVVRIGPAAIREPVRVVAVVDEPNRCGFSYGTRSGHPVSGEEAFIVHRDAAGAVSLTLRSLTLPARGWRRLAFPVFVAAQRVLRRRYLDALAG
jgi:uncharacterized protein (UPF0548 family)